MATDRILSATAKVARAKEHVENLKLAVRAFLDEGPYLTMAYDEQETGDRVVRLNASLEIPLRISIIVGDVIHNLRSGLDHLAWQICLACNGTPDRNTCFPVFEEKPTNIEAEIERKIPSARPEVIGLIRDLEPYKRGKGEKLSQLHQLNLIDKHRLLVATGNCNFHINVAGVVPIESFFPNIKRPLLGLPPRGVALKHGDELIRVPKAKRPAGYKDPQFIFMVALGEVCEGEPIVPAMEKFIDASAGVIDALSPLLK
jgi:hypothetical protein